MRSEEFVQLLDLSHLTQEEANLITEVIRKDNELQQLEKTRLRYF